MYDTTECFPYARPSGSFTILCACVHGERIIITRARPWCVNRVVCTHIAIISACVVKTLTKQARGFLLIRLRHRRIPFIPRFRRRSSRRRRLLPFASRVCGVFKGVVQSWWSEVWNDKKKKIRRKKAIYGIHLQFTTTLPLCHPKMIDRVTCAKHIFPSLLDWWLIFVTGVSAVPWINGNWKKKKLKLNWIGAVFLSFIACLSSLVSSSVSFCTSFLLLPAPPCVLWEIVVFHTTDINRWIALCVNTYVMILFPRAHVIQFKYIDFLCTVFY